MNGLRRTTYLRRRAGLRRTGLRRESQSETSQIKRRIQALLREIVIERDRGCIFRHYPEAGKCGGYGSRGLILQADHIVSRARSLTFGLSENVVATCHHHHIYWKRRNPALWADLVRKHIGVERFAWLMRLGGAKARQSFTAYDWRKVEWGLRGELGKLRGTRG